MGLSAGIVGLPNVGKSSLFNALTKLSVESANYPFATIEANVGIVSVIDQRLKDLARIYKSEKTIFAPFEFVDIAGLVKGASKGEGLGNKFLQNIREVDAICHVVRCFDNKEIIHVENSVDPIRDIETINLELILSDIESISNRIYRIAKKAQSGDKESMYELDLLNLSKEKLEKETMLNTINFNEREMEVLKVLNLLTIKPVIFVANLSEEEIPHYQDCKHYQDVKKYASNFNFKVVPISVKIEEELVQLDDDSKIDYMKLIGIKESGIEVLIKSAYELLKLRTFFTAGPKEARAWTFVEGWKAPKCAGVIHTDFERGFIKAEVMHCSDLLELKNEQLVKEKGKLGIQGKEYLVKDGDVILFRFNV